MVCLGRVYCASQLSYVLLLRVVFIPKHRKQSKLLEGLGCCRPNGMHERMVEHLKNKEIMISKTPRAIAICDILDLIDAELAERGIYR